MNVQLILKRVLASLQALVMVAAIGGTAVTGATVLAMPMSAAAATTCSISNTTDPLGAGEACSKGGSQKSTLFGATGGIFTIIANTLTLVVGAISVIYIILGGLRYVTSSGDSKSVTAAKDTILYAVIGVVVSVVAFALVNFVSGALSSATS